MRIALATPDEWDAPPDTTLSSFGDTSFTPWHASRRSAAGGRLATRRSTRVASAGRRATPVEQVSITLADGRPIRGRLLPAAWFDRRVFDLDRRHFDRDLRRAGRALRPLIFEIFGGKVGTVPPS